MSDLLHIANKIFYLIRIEKETDMKNITSKRNLTEFEIEILPHKSSLRSFALKLTGDEEDADDLLQDTLLKAFRFFDSFEKGTNSKAWVFRIMKNSFINDYRKNVKQPNKVDYEDVQNFYENIKASEVKVQHLQEDAFSSVLDDNITNAIASLPSDFQTIIILSDLEGYTYEEIADFVNIPIGTVRSRLHRARKMMYSKLYSYARKRGYVQEEVLN